MTDKYPNISIAIPTYKCNDCILELYKRLKEIFEKNNIDHEIIFINDASPQNDWEAIKQIAEEDKRVKGINLSRNFGQHYAITAGLSQASGEWIVVMDCDLQDKPEEIINLYNKAKEGYDIVLAKRIKRKDKFIKKIFSKIFYNILGYLTNTKQDSSIANFGIYHKNVIKAVCNMHDSIRYFPAMIKWVGFKHTTIYVKHGEREIGKTSYSFKKLIDLSLDIMLAFSDKPLRLTAKFGLLVSLTSVVFAIYNLIKYLKGEIEVLGWSSLIISIWFLSGLIIFVLGIVGLYVGKTFEKVKNRPPYIISESVNC